MRRRGPVLVSKLGKPVAQLHMLLQISIPAGLRTVERQLALGAGEEVARDVVAVSAPLIGVPVGRGAEAADVAAVVDGNAKGNHLDRVDGGGRPADALHD